MTKGSVWSVVGTSLREKPTSQLGFPISGGLPLKHLPFLQLGPVADYDGASCVDEMLDPETWYIDDPVTQGIAKGFCALCPFGPRGNDMCFEEALVQERMAGFMAFGVRGGRTAAKRQRILDHEKLVKEWEAEVAKRLSSECISEDEGVEETETSW